MDRQVIDRRSEPRFAAAAFDIEGATLRPGFTVRVVDVGPTGAQLLSERPLRPGGRVHVRFWGAAGAVSLSAVILRCAVRAIAPAAGITYCAALRFDRRVPEWACDSEEVPVPRDPAVRRQSRS